MVSLALGSCTSVLNEISTMGALAGIAIGVDHARRNGEAPGLARRHLDVADHAGFLEPTRQGPTTVVISTALACT